MSADKKLKAYIDRVLRLKEEQDTLGQDIRDVYAEAKSEGYDKTVMGKLVAHLRKVEKSGVMAVTEEVETFEVYLNAYERASGTAIAIAHAHEEEFDPIAGEFKESPRKAAEAVSERTAFQVENENSAEATTEGQPSLTVATSAESAGEAAPVDLPTNSEIAPAAHDEAAAPSAEQRKPQGSSAAANTGGDHVTAQRSTAAQAGDPVSKPPAAYSLRPHCRNPGNGCGGYGSTHCHSCKLAMREMEEV